MSGVVGELLLDQEAFVWEQSTKGDLESEYILANGGFVIGAEVVGQFGMSQVES